MLIRKKIRSPFSAIIIALLVLIAIVFFALEKMGITNFYNTQEATSGPTEAQKKEQRQADQEQKQQFIENDNSVDTTPSSTAANIELSSQQEQDGSVTVFTKLYSISDGNCTLSVTNGPNNYSQTVPLIYQPNFSSCAGFSIQKDKLGVGEWTITVAIASNPSTSKTIKVQVN